MFQDGKSLVVINVYCPRADPERSDRLAYKLRFYRLLHLRCSNFAARGHHVVVVGDVNTSHREIDHCDPYEVSSFAITLGNLLYNNGSFGHPGFRIAAWQAVARSLPEV